MGVKPITWEIRGGGGAGGDRAAGAGDTYSQTPLVRVFFGKWQGAVKTEKTVKAKAKEDSASERAQEAK